MAVLVSGFGGNTAHASGMLPTPALGLRKRWRRDAIMTLGLDLVIEEYAENCESLGLRLGMRMT